ncbi:hypothetical protein HUT19_04870 [Streptomyces sp. NA02950]|uniref:hypothetical protein n=1 Tax=Streptomyces sp. NA02950 TaxID=2742137 RepID=UPI0015906D1C|nr:hypothetical protein [Streptomyces sp. NA02950]QKV91154.1 hypothetical protein HUT19_04870 [Streptomyces sp. NA02950]
MGVLYGIVRVLSQTLVPDGAIQAAAGILRDRAALTTRLGASDRAAQRITRAWPTSPSSAPRSPRQRLREQQAEPTGRAVDFVSGLRGLRGIGGEAAAQGPHAQLLADSHDRGPRAHWSRTPVTGGGSPNWARTRSWCVGRGLRRALGVLARPVLIGGAKGAVDHSRLVMALTQNLCGLFTIVRSCV